LRIHQIFVAFNIKNKDNHNDDGNEKNKNTITLFPFLDTIILANLELRFSDLM